MSELAEKIKGNLRETSYKLSLFSVRLLTGALIGTTLALIVRGLTPVSTFIFMFVVITAIAVVLRLTRYWSYAGTIILLLVFALIAVLLKLYIHTAATI